MRQGFNYTIGAGLLVALAGCDSPDSEAIAHNCQGVAQQECLIVALRDCKLLTSARQEEFNACEPYKRCSDSEFERCVKEEK